VELEVEIAEVTKDEKVTVTVIVPSLIEIVIFFTLLVDVASDDVRDVIVLVSSLVTASDS